MIYVLDANVFIEAARRYYAFDLAPRFWEGLIQFVSEERIKSIDRVKKELQQKEDTVRDWLDNGGFENGFASTDASDIAQLYKDIIAWVYGQPQFYPSAKTEFASGADGWLVSYSKTKGFTVVTQEVLRPDVKRKVPIPNVCQAFSVPYVDTFEMLRALEFRFS